MDQRSYHKVGGIVKKNKISFPWNLKYKYGKIPLYKWHREWESSGPLNEFLVFYPAIHNIPQVTVYQHRHELVLIDNNHAK